MPRRSIEDGETRISPFPYPLWFGRGERGGMGLANWITAPLGSGLTEGWVGGWGLGGRIEGLSLLLLRSWVGVEGRRMRREGEWGEGVNRD